MEKPTVDQLAAKFAHDMRGALSVLTINVDFTLDELNAIPGAGASDEVREALTDCRSAGVRLARIISNFIDALSCTGGALVTERSSVDATALFASVAEACEAEARRAGATLAVTTAPATISGDPALLGRAMEHIVLTLIDLATPGGRVEVLGAVAGRAFTARLHWTPRTGHPLASPIEPAPWKDGLGMHFCRGAVEAQGGGLVVGEDEVLVALPLAGSHRAAA